MVKSFNDNVDFSSLDLISFEKQFTLGSLDHVDSFRFRSSSSIRDIVNFHSRSGLFDSKSHFIRTAILFYDRYIEQFGLDGNNSLVESVIENVRK